MTPAADRPRRLGQAVGIGGAVAAVLPALGLRLAGGHPDPLLAALPYGTAVVGAAFMLGWAAEVVQLDVPAGLALALLALIAVLPEYAVDLVFAWKAGKDPRGWAPYALANMTGGNQLLIGLGWSLVVLLAAWRTGGRGRAGASVDTEVALERSHAVEISFLVLATLYGLTLPFRHAVTLLDAVVLVAIFVGYVVRIARAPAEQPHLVGPARMIGELPEARRRQVVVALFAGSAGAILLCAEPFAESLVDTGTQLGIDKFVLVQLVAPLASEAPELLIAGMFAWRLNTNAGLGALVSSKVNQWTLLVGTLPVVFAISSASRHGLPIDTVQREELWVTAAQSAYAVAVLANRKISVREASVMLGLFVVQLLTRGLPGHWHDDARVTIGAVYLLLAVAVVAHQRRALPGLLRDGFRTSPEQLAA